MTLRTFIIDRTTGELQGHSISEDAAGGLVREVRIANTSDSTEHISFHFETAGVFPATFTALLFDGATGRFSENGSFDVNARSTVSRWLAIGDNEFIDRFRASAATFSYGLARIYPNPSRSVVNFRFSVGFGAQEQVRMTIFDLHGRKVWEKRLTTLLEAGEHVITWNGYDRNRCAVGAGRYPVRLNFINNSGKIVRQFDRVLTYIP